MVTTRSKVVAKQNQNLNSQQPGLTTTVLPLTPPPTIPGSRNRTASTHSARSGRSTRPAFPKSSRTPQTPGNLRASRSARSLRSPRSTGLDLGSDPVSGSGAGSRRRGRPPIPFQPLGAPPSPCNEGGGIRNNDEHNANASPVQRTPSVQQLFQTVQVVRLSPQPNADARPITVPPNVESQTNTSQPHQPQPNANPISDFDPNCSSDQSNVVVNDTPKFVSRQPTICADEDNDYSEPGGLWDDTYEPHIWGILEPMARRDEYDMDVDGDGEGELEPTGDLRMDVDGHGEQNQDQDQDQDQDKDGDFDLDEEYWASAGLESNQVQALQFPEYATQTTQYRYRSNTPLISPPLVNPPLVNPDAHPSANRYGWKRLPRMDFWKVRPEYRVGRYVGSGRGKGRGRYTVSDADAHAEGHSPRNGSDGDNGDEDEEDFEGREVKKNDIVLPGGKISNTHAIFRWNGREDQFSIVTIEDVSRNGTSVNGSLIGKGKTKILRDRDIVEFGPMSPILLFHTKPTSTLMAGAPRSGYNICNSTTEGSSSMCQTAYINHLDDFCLFAPSKPDSTIGDTEGEEVAWCTKPGRGTRLIPEGALKGVQLVQSPGYIQIAGVIDQTKVNIQEGDFGGELDSGGQDGRGNPIGGLLYSNAFPSNNGKNDSFQQSKHWTFFMGDGTFCAKACDDTQPNAEHLCEHIYDRIDCTWNAPNNAQEGVFERCDGDDMTPVGVYTSNGQTLTWTQPPESEGAVTSVPYTPTPAASSNCVTFSSADLYNQASGSGSGSGSGSNGGSGASNTGNAAPMGVRAGQGMGAMVMAIGSVFAVIGVSAGAVLLV
ncbi:hypothetical protein D9758_013021 [Tetrapyrgos nigripes]|uniref:FHA domain-containing protein n=1 Tax=Tetrapyrgos nigripes TaxID=182062 RepID=A0A8H5CAS1_9AGAR|nr:hypothetical protein D9758_013021 [Tetrapyrgos nigripes]